METMLSQVTSLLVEALNGSGNQSTVLAGESARLISLVDVASLSSNNDHVTNTLSDASEPTLIDLRLETPARINRIKGGNNQHRRHPCFNFMLMRGTQFLFSRSASFTLRSVLALALDSSTERSVFEQSEAYLNDPQRFRKPPRYPLVEPLSDSSEEDLEVAQILVTMARGGKFPNVSAMRIKTAS